MEITLLLAVVMDHYKDMIQEGSFIKKIGILQGLIS